MPCERKNTRGQDGPGAHRYPVEVEEDDMMKKYSIVEYSSGFAIVRNSDGEERWLSDGVDMFFGKNDRALSPGTQTWWKHAEAFCEDESMIDEAYFPE